MVLEFTLGLLANIWFWIFLMVIIMSIMSILMVSYRNDLQKTLEDLQTALSQEDMNINQNFEKIHRDLSIVERELNHSAKIAEEFYKEKSKVSQTSAYERAGKKIKKYLTPKGKIKKQYLDNPIAQKCYVKFNNLQAV